MLDSTAPPSSTTTQSAAAAKTSDFELRHWRSSPLRSRVITSTSKPPAISVPNSNGNQNQHQHRGGSTSSSPGSASPLSSSNYTSLRDIIGSPSSSAASISSPSPDSAAVIHVRNRLVVRAAHAYLQLTPSGAESSFSSHRKGDASAIWLCCSSCFSFLHRLFGCFRRRSYW